MWNVLEMITNVKILLTQSAKRQMKAILLDAIQMVGLVNFNHSQQVVYCRTSTNFPIYTTTNQQHITIIFLVIKKHEIFLLITERN